MTNLITLINSALTPETQRMFYLISSGVQESAEEVYCSGNFVRDLFLGVENRKIDLIVTGPVADFARSLIAFFPGELDIYDELPEKARILSGGFTFKITAARKEFNPFSEPMKQDALKKTLFVRDFTIDTLAFSLNMENFGELFDFFGGHGDIEAKKLRVLYKMSFADNPLRILRLLRLEQRLDFTIEEETNLLLSQAVKKKFLEKVSKESLSREIRLLFREFSPVRMLIRLEELKLFSQLFPRVTPSFGLFQKLGLLEDSLRQNEDQATESPFIPWLAVICSDLSENDTNYLSRRLRLKPGEKKQLQKIMQNAECRMQN